MNNTHILRNGFHYGYPKCCAVWYYWYSEAIDNNNEPELTKAQKALLGTGFIPCPKCAETVTKKTVHTLIKDRICKKKFPKDDTDARHKNLFALFRMLNVKVRNRNAAIQKQHQ